MLNRRISRVDHLSVNGEFGDPWNQVPAFLVPGLVGRLGEGVARHAGIKSKQLVVTVHVKAPVQAVLALVVDWLVWL